MTRPLDISDQEYIAILESKLAEYERPILKPPTLGDVVVFFRQHGYKPSAAETAWNYYEKIRKAENGRVWRDNSGRVIKNWKLKMRTVWFSNENKIQDEIQRGF